MSTYEDRHRALRDATAVDPLAQPEQWRSADRAAEQLEAFYEHTAPLVDDVIAAAREMLKFGAHDGPCEPTQEDSRCRLHTDAFDRRWRALMDTLARLDEAAR